jgi:hypothetical protein
MLVADCVIKDISESGCRLYVRPGIWIPAEFVINCSLIGVPVRGVTVWRSGSLLGVRFVS